MAALRFKKLYSSFPQFARYNRQKLSGAMKDLAKIVHREIIANTSPAPGGHLHDTGDMRRATTVMGVGGTNPRIEVRTTDYGVYQDQGFTHYLSGEFIHNPWISPVIRSMRSDMLRFLSHRLKTGKAPKGVSLAPAKVE